MNFMCRRFCDPEDKYRNIVEIYLDADWHRARQLRLQKYAEKIKVLRKSEAKKECIRKAAKAKHSAER